MSSRTTRRAGAPVLLAVTAAALFLHSSCRDFDTPEASPKVPVEYSVEHYRISDNPEDFAAWKREVRALRETLREEYPFEERAASLEGPSKEVEFLNRSVDPAGIIWRDPSAFWREPVSLSWWELIDETGAIRKVFVITSNQTPETDARIIAWCLEGKTWTPAIKDGVRSASIRSASINLGESPWHIAHWQKKVSEESAAVMLVLIIAVAVCGAWRFSQRRQSGRRSA